MVEVVWCEWTRSNVENNFDACHLHCKFSFSSHYFLFKSPHLVSRDSCLRHLVFFPLTFLSHSIWTLFWSWESERWEWDRRLLKLAIRHVLFSHLAKSMKGSGKKTWLPNDLDFWMFWIISTSERIELPYKKIDWMGIEESRWEWSLAVTVTLVYRTM